MPSKTIIYRIPEHFFFSISFFKGCRATSIRNTDDNR